MNAGNIWSDVQNIGCI